MFKVCSVDNMYSISDKGEVYSHFTNRLLNPYISKRGYYVVNVRVNGKRKSYSVHRLVAENFLEPIEGKTDVNHKDGNKLNNNLDNLEWCDDLDNKRHAWLNGLMRKGEDCSKTGLKESTVRLVCSVLEKSFTIGEILLELQGEPVNRSTILNIRSFRSWKHISKDYKWEVNPKYRNSLAKKF